MRQATKQHFLFLSGSLVVLTLCRPANVLGDAVFERDVQPFLAQYCVSCHGQEKQRGDLNLALYASEEAVQRDRNTWQTVQRMIFGRQMPPKERPQPSQGERDLLVEWIDRQLASIDGYESERPQDPGHVTLRRLNRTEYANTIRDFLGVPFDAKELPTDDVGHGFDSIGDVLSLSPALFEKYAGAAERITAHIVHPTSEAQTSNSGGPHVFVCAPDGHDWEPCARKILRQLTRRAYRRPPHEDEVRRLVEIVKVAQEGGETFRRSIALALEAVLLSPHFLFHVVASDPAERSGEVYLLDDHELAARLSYFLWRSLPDDELFALAQSGGLRREEVLAGQIRRMLASSKADALATSFAGQWLQLDKLASSTPDPERFPEFSETLRQAMRRESELFFGDVVGNDRSILEFLDANFTFLNEALAEHYAYPSVEGDQFRRVELKDGRRGGVLTQASVLTLTSNPTRTSPVNRGKWILEQILGSPPPPPPPEVEQLPEDSAAAAHASLRDRLEIHRADPGCAGCHDRMDPLGFALENFDAIGAWRERDGPFRIDNSGTLPDGSSFEGPRELKQLLLERRQDFVRCFTQKMLTYAVGRGLEYYDHCAVEKIVTALANDDYRFSRLVVEVVKSVPFRKRRGPKPPESTQNATDRGD